MTILALLLFAAMITQASQAPATDAAQDQPEIKFLKFNWRKMQHVDIEEKDRERAQEIRDRKIYDEYRKNEPNWSVIRDNELRTLNQVHLPDPPAARKAYEYNVQVKNGSAKEVVSLKWTYIFTDPIDKQELVRHSFESKAKIGPGKDKKISVYTDSSPPSVINAQAQTKNGSAWEEAVILESVQYSDGTGWKRN